MQTDGFSGILTASVEKALRLNDAVILDDGGDKARRTAAARENIELEGVRERMAEYEDEDARRSTHRTSA